MPFLPSQLIDRLIPTADPARTATLITAPIAHRGLHGDGIVENSLAAFEAAIAAGHGIECDVQSAIDGTPFVFHDLTLERLAGRPDAVASLSPAELETIELSHGGGPIMRLDDLLRLVAGRVPLFVEIKAKREFKAEFCRRIRGALEGYRGPVSIMSFHPLAVRWFRNHGENIPRGMVITEEDDRGLRGDIKRLLAIRASAPDFLAYDIRDLPSAIPAAARKKGLATVSWTVRTEAQFATAKACVDQPIYERQAAPG